MRTIKCFLRKLPTYFKVLVLLLFLMNLAGIVGYNEKKAIDQQLNQLFSAFSQVSGEMNITSGKLHAQKQLVKEQNVEVGVLVQPSGENFLFFDTEQLTISLNDKRYDFQYEPELSSRIFPKKITEMAIYLSQVLFVLTVIQNLIMCLFVILGMILATLILSKFKLKIKAITESLFISVPIGAIFGMIFSLLGANYLAMFGFVGMTGVFYAIRTRKKMVSSVTSYYLGEEVYE